LGRLKRSEEKLIVNVILSHFPEFPDETITWSELWRRVKRAKGQKIRSKETLAKYLKQLVKIGLVIERGKEYSFSSTYHLWEREAPLEWHDKTIEDREAFRELLAMQFTFILASYMEMLDGLIDIEDERKARDYVDSFFRIIPPERQLTLFATEVWRKRKTVPLKAIEKEAIEKGGILSFSLEVRPNQSFEL
jgi:hypothetical protein